MQTRILYSVCVSLAISFHIRPLPLSPFPIALRPTDRSGWPTTAIHTIIACVESSWGEQSTGRGRAGERNGKMVDLFAWLAERDIAQQLAGTPNTHRGLPFSHKLLRGINHFCSAERSRPFVTFIRRRDSRNLEQSLSPGHLQIDRGAPQPATQSKNTYESFQPTTNFPLSFSASVLPLSPLSPSFQTRSHARGRGDSA